MRLFLNLLSYTPIGYTKSPTHKRVIAPVPAAGEYQRTDHVIKTEPITARANIREAKGYGHMPVVYEETPQQLLDFNTGQYVPVMNNLSGVRLQIKKEVNNETII